MITLNNCPPIELLNEATRSGDTSDLADWFIGQASPGYSFQTIVDFVAERRSQNSKPKTKRAPSSTRKTRKAKTTTTNGNGDT